MIFDEFVDDLNTIRLLVSTFSSPTQSPKLRIAAANAATLLVAATFEEFVREMAREYARLVVARAPSFERLPPKLVSTAWRRTMDGLSKIKMHNPDGSSSANTIIDALARFTVIHDFCRGDLSKDIYRDLIHNEHNMRPAEINGLFKVSGLSDVCTKSSDKAPILDIFGETDAGRAHSKFVSGLESFFERRNLIAHSLSPTQSNGPDQIAADIDLLLGFGGSLQETLNILSRL